MLLSHPDDNSRSDAIDTAPPLSIVTMAFDRDTQRLLKIWLPAANVREVTDYVEDGLLEESGNSGLDVCIIDFDQDPLQALKIAEHIHSENGEIAIFAVSSDAQPDIIIQAMRSGCREYLFKPLVRDQLLQAIARVSNRRRERKERSTAQVVTFIGAKGGCGTTTLATQLGTILAGSSSKKKTLLLDLHPTLGDAALYLGFTATRYHSYELMENTDRLDAALLQSMALHHSSGLDVVPAPVDFENARHAASGTMSHTFNVLRDLYDFILVDAPAGLNDETAKLIGYSDWVYVVTVAEVSALRNVSRIVDYVKMEEIPPEKIRLVLNRFDKRSPITEAQIEKVTQRKIFWSVPNQYQQAVKTITTGDSAANSKTELLRNLKEWAESIAGAKAVADVKVDKQKKRGILGLFGDAR